MPGPNVLDLVGDIREAVERLPKEALVDILVYVFKEYVVEGPAPVASAPQPVSDDLAGLAFGPLVRELQLRLDLPELELFSVEESGRVQVRVGGRLVPLEAAASRPEPPTVAPVVPPPSVAAPAPPVVVTPAAAAPPIPPPARPQPSPPAALSTNARPAAPAAAPAAPSPASAPAAPGAAAGSGGGLLEID